MDRDHQFILAKLFLSGSAVGLVELSTYTQFETETSNLSLYIKGKIDEDAAQHEFLEGVDSLLCERPVLHRGWFYSVCSLRPALFNFGYQKLLTCLGLNFGVVGYITDYQFLIMKRSSVSKIGLKLISHNKPSGNIICIVKTGHSGNLRSDTVTSNVSLSSRSKQILSSFRKKPPRSLFLSLENLNLNFNQQQELLLQQSGQSTVKTLGSIPSSSKKRHKSDNVLGKSELFEKLTGKTRKRHRTSSNTSDVSNAAAANKCDTCIPTPAKVKLAEKIAQDYEAKPSSADTHHLEKKKHSKSKKHSSKKHSKSSSKESKRAKDNVRSPKKSFKDSLKDKLGRKKEKEKSLEKTKSTDKHRSSKSSKLSDKPYTQQPADEVFSSVFEVASLSKQLGRIPKKSKPNSEAVTPILSKLGSEISSPSGLSTLGSEIVSPALSKWGSEASSALSKIGSPAVSCFSSEVPSPALSKLGSEIVSPVVGDSAGHGNKNTQDALSSDYAMDKGYKDNEADEVESPMVDMSTDRTDSMELYENINKGLDVKSMVSEALSGGFKSMFDCQKLQPGTIPGLGDMNELAYLREMEMRQPRERTIRVTKCDLKISFKVDNYNRQNKGWSKTTDIKNIFYIGLYGAIVSKSMEKDCKSLHECVLSINRKSATSTWNKSITLGGEQMYKITLTNTVTSIQANMKDSAVNKEVRVKPSNVIPSDGNMESGVDQEAVTRHIHVPVKPGEDTLLIIPPKLTVDLSSDDENDDYGSCQKTMDNIEHQIDLTKETKVKKENDKKGEVVDLTNKKEKEMNKGKTAALSSKPIEVLHSKVYSHATMHEQFFSPVGKTAARPITVDDDKDNATNEDVRNNTNNIDVKTSNLGSLGNSSEAKPKKITKLVEPSEAKPKKITKLVETSKLTELGNCEPIKSSSSNASEKRARISRFHDAAESMSEKSNSRDESDSRAKKSSREESESRSKRSTRDESRDRKIRSRHDSDSSRSRKSESESRSRRNSSRDESESRAQKSSSRDESDGRSRKSNSKEKEPRSSSTSEKSSKISTDKEKSENITSYMQKLASTSDYDANKNDRAEKRRNRQYHPYKKEKSGHHTPHWSFDLAYSDMNELLQNLTQNTYRKLKHTPVDVSRIRRHSGRGPRDARFYSYRFVRSCVYNTPPREESSSEDDFDLKDIPELKARAQQADLLEEKFTSNNKDEGEFTRELQVYEKDVLKYTNDKKVRPRTPLTVPGGGKTSTYSRVDLNEDSDDELAFGLSNRAEIDKDKKSNSSKEVQSKTSTKVVDSKMKDTSSKSEDKRKTESSPKSKDLKKKDSTSKNDDTRKKITKLRSDATSNIEDLKKRDNTPMSDNIKVKDSTPKSDDSKKNDSTPRSDTRVVQISQKTEHVPKRDLKKVSSADEKDSSSKHTELETAVAKKFNSSKILESDSEEFLDWNDDEELSDKDNTDKLNESFEEMKLKNNCFVVVDSLEEAEIGEMAHKTSLGRDIEKNKGNSDQSKKLPGKVNQTKDTCFVVATVSDKENKAAIYDDKVSKSVESLLEEEARKPETSSTPAKTTNPQASTTHTKATKTEVSSTQAKATKPEAFTTQAKATKPEDSTTPAKATKPEVSTSQAKASKPEVSTTQAKPTKPEASSAQAKATKTEASTTQAKASIPEASSTQTKATKPEASSAQAKATKHEASTAQAKATKPEASTTQAKATKPKESTTQAKATKPEVSSAQAKATKPEVSTAQAKATKPEASTAQAKATKPEASSAQAKATKPEVSSAQAKTTKPEVSSTQAKAAKPNVSTTLEKASKPEASTTQAKASKPEVASAQAKATKPEVSITQVKPTKPEVSITQVKATKPEVSTTQVKDTKPEVSTTRAKATKPEASTAQAKATKPEASSAQAKATKPEASSAQAKASKPEAFSALVKATKPEASSAQAKATKPEASSAQAKATKPEASFAQTKAFKPEVTTTQAKATEPEASSVQAKATLTEVSSAQAKATKPEAPSAQAKATKPEASSAQAKAFQPEVSTTQAKATKPEVSTTQAKASKPEVSTTQAKATKPEVSTTQAKATKAEVSSAQAKATKPEASSAQAKATKPEASTAQAKATKPEVSSAQAKATKPEVSTTQAKATNSEVSTTKEKATKAEVSTTPANATKAEVSTAQTKDDKSNNEKTDVDKDNYESVTMDISFGDKEQDGKSISSEARINNLNEAKEKMNTECCEVFDYSASQAEVYTVSDSHIKYVSILEDDAEIIIKDNLTETDSESCLTDTNNSNNVNDTSSTERLVGNQANVHETRAQHLLTQSDINANNICFESNPDMDHSDPRNYVYSTNVPRRPYSYHRGNSMRNALHRPFSPRVGLIQQPWQPLPRNYFHPVGQPYPPGEPVPVVPVNHGMWSPNHSYPYDVTHQTPVAYHHGHGQVLLPDPGPPPAWDNYNSPYNSGFYSPTYSGFNSPPTNSAMAGASWIMSPSHMTPYMHGRNPDAFFVIQCKTPSPGYTILSPNTCGDNKEHVHNDLNKDSVVKDTSVSSVKQDDRQLEIDVSTIPMPHSPILFNPKSLKTLCSKYAKPAAIKWNTKSEKCPATNETLRLEDITNKRETNIDYVSKSQSDKTVNTSQKNVESLQSLSKKCYDKLMSGKNEHGSLFAKKNEDKIYNETVCVLKRKPTPRVSSLKDLCMNVLSKQEEKNSNCTKLASTDSSMKDMQKHLLPKVVKNHSNDTTNELHETCAKEVMNDVILSIEKQDEVETSQKIVNTGVQNKPCVVMNETGDAKQVCKDVSSRDDCHSMLSEVHSYALTSKSDINGTEMKNLPNEDSGKNCKPEIQHNGMGNITQGTEVGNSVDFEEELKRFYESVKTPQKDKGGSICYKTQAVSEVQDLKLDTPEVISSGSEDSKGNENVTQHIDGGLVVKLKDISLAPPILPTDDKIKQSIKERGLVKSQKSISFEEGRTNSDKSVSIDEGKLDDSKTTIHCPESTLPDQTDRKKTKSGKVLETPQPSNSKFDNVTKSFEESRMEFYAGIGVNRDIMKGGLSIPCQIDNQNTSIQINSLVMEKTEDGQSSCVIRNVQACQLINTNDVKLAKNENAWRKESVAVAETKTVLLGKTQEQLIEHMENNFNASIFGEKENALKEAGLEEMNFDSTEFGKEKEHSTNLESDGNDIKCTINKNEISNKEVDTGDISEKVPNDNEPIDNVTIKQTDSLNVIGLAYSEEEIEDDNDAVNACTEPMACTLSAEASRLSQTGSSCITIDNTLKDSTTKENTKDSYHDANTTPKPVDGLNTIGLAYTDREHEVDNVKVKPTEMVPYTDTSSSTTLNEAMTSISENDVQTKLPSSQAEESIIMACSVQTDNSSHPSEIDNIKETDFVGKPLANGQNIINKVSLHSHVNANTKPKHADSLNIIGLAYGDVDSEGHNTSTGSEADVNTVTEIAVISSQTVEDNTNEWCYQTVKVDEKSHPLDLKCKVEKTENEIPKEISLDIVDRNFFTTEHTGGAIDGCVKTENDIDISYSEGTTGKTSELNADYHNVRCKVEKNEGSDAEEDHVSSEHDKDNTHSWTKETLYENWLFSSNKVEETHVDDSNRCPDDNRSGDNRNSDKTNCSVSEHAIHAVISSIRAEVENLKEIETSEDNNEMHVNNQYEMNEEFPVAHIPADSLNVIGLAYGGEDIDEDYVEALNDVTNENAETHLCKTQNERSSSDNVNKENTCAPQSEVDDMMKCKWTESDASSDEDDNESYCSKQSNTPSKASRCSPVYEEDLTSEGFSTIETARANDNNGHVMVYENVEETRNEIVRPKYSETFLKLRGIIRFGGGNAESVCLKTDKRVIQVVSDENKEMTTSMKDQHQKKDLQGRLQDLANQTKLKSSDLRCKIKGNKQNKKALRYKVLNASFSKSKKVIREDKREQRRLNENADRLQFVTQWLDDNEIGAKHKSSATFNPKAYPEKLPHQPTLDSPDRNPCSSRSSSVASQSSSRKVNYSDSDSQSSHGRDSSVSSASELSKRLLVKPKRKYRHRKSRSSSSERSLGELTSTTSSVSSMDSRSVSIKGKYTEYRRANRSSRSPSIGSYEKMAEKQELSDGELRSSTDYSDGSSSKHIPTNQHMSRKDKGVYRWRREGTKREMRVYSSSSDCRNRSFELEPSPGHSKNDNQNQPGSSKVIDRSRHRDRKLEPHRPVQRSKESPMQSNYKSDHSGSTPSKSFRSPSGKSYFRSPSPQSKRDGKNLIASPVSCDREGSKCRLLEDGRPCGSTSNTESQAPVQNLFKNGTSRQKKRVLILTSLLKNTKMSDLVYILQKLVQHSSTCTQWILTFLSSQLATLDPSQRSIIEALEHEHSCLQIVHSVDNLDTYVVMQLKDTNLQEIFIITEPSTQDENVRSIIRYCCLDTFLNKYLT